MIRDRFWYWLYGIFEDFFGELYYYFLTKRLYVGRLCRRCKGVDGMHRPWCSVDFGPYLK